MSVINANELSGLDLIQHFFPKQAHLSIASVAILLGCAEQSIRNAISKNTFPIISSKEGAKRYCDVRDVAMYLDSKRKVAHTIPKRRRGRPTKAEQLSNQRSW
jgi:hypothetical protein